MSMLRIRKNNLHRAPGRRQKNKERTREAILQAALDLFGKKGFARATTKEIARRAGVAEGTIFNYFRTKDDIALHFFRREVAHVIASFERDARLRRAPIEEKLFAVIQKQLEYLTPYRGFLGEILFQALRPASSLHPLSLESQRLNLDYLEFIRRIFETSPETSRASMLGALAPQVFLIYYLGVLLFWLHDDSPGQEATLAFLDRSLKIGLSVLRGAAHAA